MSQKHLISTLLLNEFRIKKFKLIDFVDFFISSSFVNLRGPGTEIFNLVLDIVKIDASESIYIDHQTLFVKLTKGFVMNNINHIDYDSTVDKLQDFNVIIMPLVYG